MPKSSPLPPPALGTQLPRDRVIQDDGVYLLVTTKGVENSRTDGLLLRRCAVSAAAPLGYECLGHHQQLSDGLWHASRGSMASGQGATGTRRTRIYATELDALVNLWASRHLCDFGPAV